MKKIIMTAALAIASFGAFAASTANNNGTLSVVVNDYITMNPSGGFVAGPITFNNPQQMVDGWSTEGTVTIVASRAWKYEYACSDFMREGGASGNVPASVPAGNIWQVMTGNGSAGVNTYNGSFIGSSNSLVNMANQGTGTLSSTFTLGAKLVPGLTNQMSGTYNATITQIASLD